MVHGAILLIIRRSWVRAPPAPPEFTCVNVRNVCTDKYRLYRAKQFTHILSKEFGPWRITVNAVGPGATETETYRTGKSEQFLASLEAMSAFGRLGQPDEIAAVVASHIAGIPAE